MVAGAGRGEQVLGVKDLVARKDKRKVWGKLERERERKGKRQGDSEKRVWRKRSVRGQTGMEDKGGGSSGARVQVEAEKGRKTGKRVRIHGVSRWNKVEVWGH